ncbi:uncharacterized protein LOC115449544 [Manduca sexta]|uniref:uncharacterized protein LOC115449544 n=1 Tax=Manduca sexta TaxID=7130 RepID=UPI00188E0212|nr:uncharacterized protein LOC115449544 [Manduca sexta]
MDEFHRGMDELQRGIQNMQRNMPKSGASIEITNNHYILQVYLNGYEDKDIEVKSKPGWVMIKAIHRDQNGKDRNYLEMLSLPDNVDPAGEWTYSQGVLKIDFKIKNSFENSNVVWHSVISVDNNNIYGHNVGQAEVQHENNDQMYTNVKH